nr:hypothetical protein [Tanacetum cinerariifolium]
MNTYFSNVSLLKVFGREICKLSYKFGDQFKLEDLRRQTVGRSKDSKFENGTWSGIMDGYMLISNNGNYWKECLGLGGCFAFFVSNPCVAKEDRMDLYKGMCFCPSDAFPFVFLIPMLQFGCWDSYEGNVARMKELLIYCEWGYTLHNDAFSYHSYAIVDDG